MPEVYNHCQPAAQVVCAHVYLWVSVCVHGKIIWPKPPTGSEILNPSD